MHAPPVLVITAQYDPLCDEDEFYLGKLRTAGVATTLTHYDGVNHRFMFWVGVVDKAGAAMSKACRAEALPLSDASWIVSNEATPSGPMPRELADEIALVVPQGRHGGGDRSATQRVRKRCGNWPGNRISNGQCRFWALLKRRVDMTSICESRRNPESSGKMRSTSAFCRS
jgi:hypothetical protein